MATEYKKRSDAIGIEERNGYDFKESMNFFLKNHPDAKIEHIIVHKPYHVTLIYSTLIKVID